MVADDKEENILDPEIKDENDLDLDNKDENGLVGDNKDENRTLVAKKKRMGDIAVEKKLPPTSPTPNSQLMSLLVKKELPFKSPSHSPLISPDGGRLQMLLERAAVEKTRLANDGTDPKDRRYKQLLEEMRQEDIGARGQAWGHQGTKQYP